MIKRKHWTAITFFAALIPLGVIGLHAVRAIQNRGYTQASANQLKPHVAMPEPGVVREIEKFMRDLNTLHPVAPTDKAPVDLSLFGYDTSQHTNLQEWLREPSNAANQGDQITYEVSLAFAGASKGFCVIDGRFYPEGGILPDGAQVVKVEAQRVLIHKFKVERWIPVTESIGVKLSKGGEEKKT
jgi:hypothetical protein